MNIDVSSDASEDKEDFLKIQTFVQKKFFPNFCQNKNLMQKVCPKGHGDIIDAKTKISVHIICSEIQFIMS